MSKVTEIEAAIAKLPPGDFRQLFRHMQELDANEWDRQIEDDASNGKLDALYRHLTESEPQKERIPLNEVLDDHKLS